MILLKKRKTKALIRLRRCAGWSAPVLFANPRRQVFLRCGPNKDGNEVITSKLECYYEHLYKYQEIDAERIRTFQNNINIKLTDNEKKRISKEHNCTSALIVN